MTKNHNLLTFHSILKDVLVLYRTIFNLTTKNKMEVQLNRYFLLLFILLTCISSFALPRFAARTGSFCVDCHVNPTGGELRDQRGWNISRKYLPLIPGKEDFEMTNKLGENILFGFDIRGQYLGYLGENSKKTDFQKMQGSFYTSVDITEDINVVGRYDYIWNIFEGFVTAHILPNESYIKGGSFVPNYGLRLDDHTAYTRGGDMGRITNDRLGLIFVPTYVESGAELGLYISDFAFLTMSVGNNLSPSIFIKDPSYTASLQIRPTLGEHMGLFFGGSFMNFKQRVGLNIQNSTMYGGFIGFGIMGFSLLGEYDIAQDYIVKDTSSSALMIEASYQIIRGLEAVVRYDRFDPLSKINDNELSRIVLGFDIFPYNFIELKTQYRIQNETPSIKNDAFVVQFHLFY